MKKTKISLLALAVLAGGITAASAASSKTELSATYEMTATNVAAPVLVPSNVPRSLVFPGLAPSSTYVTTDGAGKIEGVTFLEFGTAASNGYVRYVTSVTGSVKGNGSDPAVVDMKLKGNGYSGAGTNVNGVLEAIGTPASLSLTFKSSGSVISNNNALLGQFNGTIKSGVAALDSLTGNGKVKNSPAYLPIGAFPVQQFNADVVQVGNKLYAQSFNPIVASGSGNVSGSKKASLSFKGIASQKGSTWKLAGTSSSIPVVGTNTTVTLFSTADLTAKLWGQSFKRTVVVTATP